MAAPNEREALVVTAADVAVASMPSAAGVGGGGGGGAPSGGGGVRPLPSHWQHQPPPPLPQQQGGGGSGSGRQQQPGGPGPPNPPQGGRRPSGGGARRRSPGPGPPGHGHHHQHHAGPQQAGQPQHGQPHQQQQQPPTYFHHPAPQPQQQHGGGGGGDATLLANLPLSGIAGRSASASRVQPQQHQAGGGQRRPQSQPRHIHGGNGNGGSGHSRSTNGGSDHSRSTIGTPHGAAPPPTKSPRGSKPGGNGGGRSGGGGNGGGAEIESLEHRLRRRCRTMAQFWPLKVSQILCVIYILVLTFSDYPLGLVDPSSGNIIDPNSVNNTQAGVIYLNGDYRPVVAIGGWQKICLAMSRMSAFSIYPMLVVIFLSKCKALHSIFIKTPLSMFLILNESHDLHVYAGRYIAVDVWIHTLFHLLRWANQGNANLLVAHRTGLTGLIVCLTVPLIALPMMVESIKVKVKYEIRKGLHYFLVVFALGMCYHVPLSAIPNGGFIGPVMGVSFGLYVLDAMWVYLFMTEKIETTTFHVLSSGVQLTMPVSKGFQKRSEKGGGYAYVCLPWVDRWQWHAFSLFEDPNQGEEYDKSVRQVFMLKAGDWTEDVHRQLQRSTVRPVWIQGPFPSPYNEATLYDNQILVASGIGITPALSVIRSCKSSRRINLVWAVRDPAMLEFFVERMYLDHDGWNLIFYTGKEPLVPALEELGNTNVRVIKGRPDLKAVLPNIVYGVESGTGRPESYTRSEMVLVKELLIERMRELEEEDGGNLSSREKVGELTAFAQSHGFSFTELLHDIQEDNRKRETAAAARQNQNKRAHQSAKTFQSDLGTHIENDDEDASSTASSSAAGDGAERSSGGASESGGVATHRASTMLREIKAFGDHEFGCSAAEPEEQHMGEGGGASASASSSSLSRRGGLGLRQRSSSRFGGGPGGPLRADSVRRGEWRAMRRTFTAGMLAGDVAKTLTSTFQPWEKNPEAEEYVRGLDQKLVLSTWGIMYCGGSAPVQRALKEISEEFQMSLHIDSFAW